MKKLGVAGSARLGILALMGCLVFAMAGPAIAQPTPASIVIDARDGSVLFARNADQRLHPASLTKMMTLYMTFEAVTQGRLGLDQRVRVSAHAARQPASKVGFRVGQQVRVRDLIRASAVRSANDAAVVLAEAIGGSEQRFAEMMTERARQLGLTATTFRNASGLTAQGHLSTARDMALLGRRLLFDFPQYYNLFGRQSTVAFGARINNTNRLLGSYSGADGIKTGFTRAAGFNLVASAERGQRRVIAVVFGGRSAAARNTEVARLLDLGLSRAPTRVAVVPPAAAMRMAGTSPLPTPRAVQPMTVEEIIVAGLREAADAIVPAAQAAVPADGALPVEEGSDVSTGPVLRVSLPEPAPGRDSTDADILVAPAVPSRSAPGRAWAVELGSFAHREAAIAQLATAAFGEVPGLASAGREVAIGTADGDGRYAARFTGLDGVTALTACAVLGAEGHDCTPVPPQLR